MRDVYDFLEEIKKRPGMYVGGSDEDRAAQLRDLELLLWGYQCALETHDIDEPGRRFTRRFSDYLRDRFRWSLACGPVAAIEAACGDDAKTWQTFWELVDAFRTSSGSTRT